MKRRLFTRWTLYYKFLAFHMAPVFSLLLLLRCSSVSGRTRYSIHDQLFSLLALDSSCISFWIFSATRSLKANLFSLACSSVSFCLICSVLSRRSTLFQYLSYSFSLLLLWFLCLLPCALIPWRSFSDFNQPPAVLVSDPEIDVIAAFLLDLFVIATITEWNISILW